MAGGTLDYGARTVKYLGEKVLQGEKQVRWFGPKELEGCKEIPTVDDTRVPKQRWPEKERGGETPLDTLRIGSRFFSYHRGGTIQLAPD